MEEDLLLKVVHLYYGLGMTQERIARQLFFSRCRISHLLREAEEKGYVRFAVRPLVYQPMDLKQYFIRTFRLEETLIVEGRYAVGSEIFSQICGRRRSIWESSWRRERCSMFQGAAPCTAWFTT